MLLSEGTIMLYFGPILDTSTKLIPREDLETMPGSFPLGLLFSALNQARHIRKVPHAESEAGPPHP